MSVILVPQEPCIVLGGDFTKIHNETVTFEREDINFVSKFGIINAYDMVLDFKGHHNLPFIYDTYQLAHFLKISRKELFSITNDCNEMYQISQIPKKLGGFREISSPNGKLKNVQKIILENILQNIPISEFATAYHRGAKLADNASPHIGKKYLLKLDLSDFFGHIRFDRVYASAFNSNYFPKQIGTMLTTLCCLDDTLPQGAPTSPALSNIVMKNFDNNFGAWCKAHNLCYTRYCDDITVSSDTSLYSAFNKAKAWLENMEFEINESKTHFVSNANRMTVTGLTVNEKVNITSDYKRNLRQEIYYVLKYGFENAIIHENITDFIDDNVVCTQSYYNHLIGKINYVLSVESGNAYFLKARDELRGLWKKAYW